jgi:molybdopterin-containing oxidoreductase family iron-sulfur binding subunit
MDDHEHLLHFHRHHEAVRDASHDASHEGQAIHRRDALRLMAASMALATAACTRQPTQRIHPWVNMPEARADGSPVFYASAVLHEGFAQGVLVATQGGRPIKVEGNPLHPASLGATDALAQAAVLALWDPDRSPAVTHRPGGARKGPPQVSDWSTFEAAWREAAHGVSGAASNGEGLRLLTGPVTSPTLRAQIDAFLRARPGARWHRYEAISRANERAGAIAAFGRELRTVHHFDKARCVVALGADPFSDGPAAVRNAMDWSRRRAAGQPCDAFAVETAPGLFGARADQRIALAPAAIDALVERLAAQTPLPGFETGVAGALRTAGRGALLVPGRALAPRTHALVHALHERLGSIGNTVDRIEAPDAGGATLAELAADMHAGRVRTLLVLDANPVYDAPGALAFPQALARVPLTLHCGLYRDETAQACDWHLPLSHAFEQWSDALAHDGTACIVQPCIAPLYDTRSLHEIVALLAGETTRDGHALVRRTWQARGGADFEAAWREWLRRGVVDGSAASAAAVSASAPAPAVPSNRSVPLTAVFAPDPCVHDGRHANSGWLQELPRPFTRHTWDNLALLGPRTARAHGLETGDVVRLTPARGDRSQMTIEAPVWVLRLHAEDAVTLQAGQGRRNAGRVGNSVGFDAYPLMPADGVTTPVQLERTGARHEFALTQHTLEDAGREPARTVAPGGRIEAGPEAPSLYERWSYPDHAWAMAIDLDACIGCNACTAACQAENNIPVVGKEEVARGRAMHWIRIDNYDSPADGATLFQPLPCMHCENAPCELVCPVGATVHDSEGLNVQVYNRCIGTRFCSNNCPYKVRRFNFLQYADESTESLKGQRNPDVTVRSRGVMEKCNYCLQRVARARQHEQRTGAPLADGDVVTACQAVCPTRAIHFGDLNDGKSDVVRQRASPRHYTLLEELNTKPRTTYLARVRNRIVPPGEKT